MLSIPKFTILKLKTGMMLVVTGGDVIVIIIIVVDSSPHFSVKMMVMGGIQELA